MVEPPKGSLSVEHLKVMAALTVEHANASSSIDLFAPQISQKMVEPPKGSLSVEHLKVMAALTVEHANASSDGGDGGLNSRARNPSPYE